MKHLQADLTKVLSHIARGIQSKPVYPAQFALQVIWIAEDGSCAKVRLCTGRDINIPTSILKNVNYLGHVESGNEHLAMASAEIDLSTDAGKLIQILAYEVARISRSFETTHARLLALQGTDINNTLARTEEVLAAESRTQLVPLDYTLPSQLLKIRFSAVAGEAYTLKYYVPDAATTGMTFDQYIQNWSIAGYTNCFSTQNPVGIYLPNDKTPTGFIGLEFVLDAAHGTPLGVPYTGFLNLNVTIVQKTT